MNPVAFRGGNVSGKIYRAGGTPQKKKNIEIRLNEVGVYGTQKFSCVKSFDLRAKYHHPGGHL